MAAPPAREVQIVATVDIPSRSPERVGKIDMLVTYRIGPYQSGMVTLPKETATEKTIQDAIKEDVKKKAKFVGMQFTV